MAVPATAVWEIKSGSTAANANGGGFDPGNVSFATDLVTTTGTSATPTVTSASDTFATSRVNDWLYIQNSTNGWIPGWYKITAISGGTVTLDASVGAAIQVDATVGYPNPKYKTNTVQGINASNSPAGNATWSVDASQQTTAVLAAATNLASDGAGVVTSASRTFKPNDVGNVLHITAVGTGFTVGWYFIMSVAAGAATLDRSPGLSKTGGTFSVGGALSFGSNTSGQTDLNFCAQITAGNRVFATGAMALASGNVAIGAGTILLPIVVIGYSTSRGVRVTGTSRPSFTTTGGAASLQGNTYVQWYDIIITGSPNGNQLFTVGGNGGAFAWNVKAVCTAGLGKVAISVGQNIIVGCEAVSYRGIAIGGSGTQVYFCWAHDSNQGILLVSPDVGVGNLITGCELGLGTTTNNGQDGTIVNNTVVGIGRGIGIWRAIVTQSSEFVLNNIVTGFTTGIYQRLLNQGSAYFSDFNDLYNNTANFYRCFQGVNDKTLDPQFTAATVVSGTAGKFAASNDRLIDTTKNFTTLGVVAGRDYLKIMGTPEWTGDLFSFSAQDTGPKAVYFKPDGLKVFALGSTNKTVYQYSLTVAWDLSTASYDSKSISVNAQNTAPNAIWFKSDGTKMYMLGATATASMYQYTLSTPWDVSTATYDTVSFSVAGQNTTPNGLYIKSDGTTFWITGATTTATVYQYTMTAWDLSTAAYATKSLAVNAQGLTPRGITFNSTGTKMFICDGNAVSVYQYSLTAWDVSTGSYDTKLWGQMEALSTNFWGLWIDPNLNDSTLFIQDTSGGAFLFGRALWKYNLPAASSIATGTGALDGTFGITSIATTTNPNDTLVLDVAPGTNTTADKVYYILAGQNFAIGANLRALGFPGALGPTTTGYLDIGAVQRQELGHGNIGVMGVM